MGNPVSTYTPTVQSSFITDLIRYNADSYTGDLFDTFFAHSLWFGPEPWIRIGYYRRLFVDLVQKTLAHRNALYTPENLLGVIFEVSTQIGLMPTAI